jgi:hypothetical protein
MQTITDFLSAFGWCLFGIAAVLMAIFVLKLLHRFDRVLALAEKGAIKRLPRKLVKMVGKL